MSCASPIRSLRLASNEPAWSRGGSDQDGLSDIFVLSDTELQDVAPELKGVRATVTIANRTNNASVEVVFQTSSDGCVWETPIPLTTGFITTNGSTTTPWYTTTSNFKKCVRFGVRVKQATGTAVELARVTLELDLELRS